MPVRRSSALRLAFLLLVSSAPACEDDVPERGAPIEQEDDEGEELEEANVCIELCYPIKQDCPPGQTCLPADPGFSCQGVASVTEGTRRKLHDPCEAGSQTCEAGLACYQVAAPGCTGGSGCCVAFCDMNDPACPDGTECYPVFEAAQMCYPNVGVCVLF